MKKTLAIAAFMCLSALTILAQDGIRFGFQASPTFSWMNANTNTINPSGTNLGLKLGMIGEYYFQENYAFTTGIGFAFNSGGTLLHQFGGNYWTKSDLGPGNEQFEPDTKFKYGIQYLEIPFGLKMRTREFGYIRYFLEPSLALGIRTQARGNIKGVGVGDEEEKFNIRNEVNNVNLSWGVGAGIEYAISETTAIILGGAFQIGFADVTDDNGTVFTSTGQKEEDSKGTINAITLRLGVIF